MLELHRSNASVAQVATLWVSTYVAVARNAKGKGMAAQRVRDYLVPFMGDLPITALTPDGVRRYRLYLHDRDLAPRSVFHLLTDLKCMLNWAVEGGHIPRSPFPRRVMPRMQETPPDRLTDFEVAAVLAIPEPQAFVIRLGLGTGMRWSELCRLRRADLERGMVVVSQTKSSRIRRIPVSVALAREIAMQGGSMVPYSPGTTTSFARFVKGHSGVSRFHVHQLRHTFACQWLEAGGSLPSLQQILGHASIVTTQMYARLSDEAVRNEAARIHGSDTYQ